jgi:hypothetical protein
VEQASIGEKNTVTYSAGSWTVVLRAGGLILLGLLLIGSVLPWNAMFGFPTLIDESRKLQEGIPTLLLAAGLIVLGIIQAAQLRDLRLIVVDDDGVTVPRKNSIRGEWRNFRDIEARGARLGMVFLIFDQPNSTEPIRVALPTPWDGIGFEAMMVDIGGRIRRARLPMPAENSGDKSALT